MTRKITPFVENIGEATAACLITMVQGNIFAFTLAHWIIASQTGVIAGGLASVAVLLARTDKRWVIAMVLGFSTAAVDWFSHPGMFGAAGTEAIVTGLGAAALSLLGGRIWRYCRRRIRAANAT